MANPFDIYSTGLGEQMGSAMAQQQYQQYIGHQMLQRQFTLEEESRLMQQGEMVVTPTNDNKLFLLLGDE